MAATTSGAYWIIVEDDRRRVIQQKQIGFSPSVLDIQTGVEHHIVVLGK
jgi:hypothetical protein